MGTTFEATDLTDAHPTNRDAAAVITPSGTCSIAATPLSATAAIGPNRRTRDGRKPAPRRNRRFDRVSALGPGAARWIVAAAIGLTALSVSLAAPASAHGSHDGGDIRHRHTSTSAVHEQADGAKTSTSPSSNTQNAALDPPASNPPTGSMPILPGHDKCKAQKDGAPGPPWCTDPSAGWEQSTLHRTDASFPTLPGADAAAETGRAAAGRGVVH
jgi:hypothetical protein